MAGARTRRKALLAGASGLVGGFCLTELLADPDFDRVVIFLRRELPLSHPKLRQQVIDFNRVSELTDFPEVDDVFCCLGTTIKKAGTQEAFYRVDFSYVHELARMASLHRARQFLLVSALGAQADSRIFYNRVKGKVEEAVKQLPFVGVQIFRPSFLVGKRKEDRPGERLGMIIFRALSFLMLGPLRKYRPIHAQRVARAMVTLAHQEPKGFNIFESNQIQSLINQL